MKRNFYRIFCAFAALSAVLALSGCSAGEKKGEDQANAVVPAYVKTTSLGKRSMAEVLSVNGTVEAVQKAVISSRVSGTIEEIAVDEGAAVRRGELLFRIDQSTYRDAVTVAQATLEAQEAAVKVAAAQLEKAKAELHKATLDLERFRRLHKDGNTSSNELETSQLNFQRAKAGVDYADSYLASQQAQVKLAAANLAIREKALQDTVITAPFDGRISRRLHEPGEEVGAEQPILHLVDDTRLRATASLPAEFYSRVQSGASKLTLTLNGRPVPGEWTVSDKLPVIETALRTFGIKADIPGKPEIGLVPGALAGMEIVLKREDSFALPLQIPVIRSGGSLIFTIEEGMAKAITVTTGITHEGWVQISAPELHEGMTVISDGQYQITDGAPVQVISQDR